MYGADDRGRTDTVLPPRDFKSLASAYSATSAKNFYPERSRGNFWRHHPDSNRGIKVLQTCALPLGYGAVSICISIITSKSFFCNDFFSFINIICLFSKNRYENRRLNGYYLTTTPSISAASFNSSIVRGGRVLSEPDCLRPNISPAPRLS